MASKNQTVESQGVVQVEIADLERRLAAAKARLRTPPSRGPSPPRPSFQSPLNSPTHYLLLLSDSQLPIGSFAFSSGLESYLTHNRRATFSSFLPLSLSSYAATTLPFVLAAHRDPSSLVALDDQLDAAVICTVGRRASVSQGRALLSIWERSFRATLPESADLPVLREFAALLKDCGSAADEVPPVSAHLAPLFGVICAVVGLTLQQTAYMYMVSHLKALVSAAVRASMFGPYQAQKVLAGEQAQRWIGHVIDREWATTVEEAGQSVPVMDLWIGRHEVLYSRIFNS
ncbi:Urease accessory protein UreF [Metarhizium album ARSEF 1941]|uniref:Urease accessory protein UreF n=1 Tax=Metarhizium album (strain ARSEF 1941) TaxID=1081103 RepID=A0A0B2X4W6_METAS|nr:Urease accessory protein UreF [Metarhizium album ARSEF 1941]KHO00336.1 Urease accessory protein UreF [Metarhizium album ARSEF 1941]